MTGNEGREMEIDVQFAQMQTRDAAVQGQHLQPPSNLLSFFSLLLI